MKKILTSARDKITYANNSCKIMAAHPSSWTSQLMTRQEVGGGRAGAAGPSPTAAPTPALTPAGGPVRTAGLSPGGVGPSVFWQVREMPLMCVQVPEPPIIPCCLSAKSPLGVFCYFHVYSMKKKNLYALKIVHCFYGKVQKPVSMRLKSREVAACLPSAGSLSAT